VSSARVVSIIVRDAHAVVHFHIRFARSRRSRKKRSGSTARATGRARTLGRHSDARRETSET